MATTRQDRPRRRRRSTRAALRRAVRARCVRRRVRRGRRRAVAGPGPAAGARRARPRSAIAARSAPTANRATAPGVALPLDRSAPRAARPAISPSGAARRSSRCSCPAAASSEPAAGALVEAVFARPGLPVARWRAVPFDATALGAAAAASRPGFAQAIVARPTRAADDPRPLADDAFERRLVVARRRLETAVRDGRRRARRPGRPVGLVPDASSTRAWSPAAGCRSSSRTSGRRCRVGVHGLPPALRDEHPSRLAARPAVPLDRPQRRDQHGPRQPRAGPRPHAATCGAKPIAADAARRRPAALAGRLRLALARRGARAADGDGLGADAGPAGLDPRGARAPALAAPARRDAPPPDRRVPRAVGRARGHRLRRRPAGRRAGRPQRAAAGVVRGDARPAGRRGLRGRRGAVRAARTRSGAAGSDRASCCWSSRAAGRSWRTPRRRRGPCARCRSTTPRGRSTRTARGGRARAGARAAADRAAAALSRRASMPSAPGSTSRRWRSRATSRSGAWATTRRPPAAAGSTARSPTTSARRSPRSRTRRSTPSASAS